MATIIKLRDHGVALGVTALTASTLYFAYLAARTQHEVERLREQNALIGREVAGLEASFAAIRTFTKNTDRMVTESQWPLAADAVRTESGATAGAFASIKDGLTAPFQKTSRSDLDRFSTVMKSLAAIKSETDLVVGRMQSVAAVLKSNRLATAAIPSMRPVDGRITSEFGVRLSPFAGKKHFHSGIDIAALSGAKVQAPADGTITFVGDFESLGRTVVIDHGGGMLTRYGHLSSYSVRVGQSVKRGEALGSVGNSGKSTGPHLHYEVWVKNVAVNPREYFFDLEGERTTVAGADKRVKRDVAADASLVGVGGNE